MNREDFVLHKTFRKIKVFTIPIEESEINSLLEDDNVLVHQLNIDQNKVGEIKAFLDLEEIIGKKVYNPERDVYRRIRSFNLPIEEMELNDLLARDGVLVYKKHFFNNMDTTITAVLDFEEIVDEDF